MSPSDFSLVVAGLRFAPALPSDAGRGLLGYASFVVAGLVVLDSVAVRRTREGRIVLAFPVRHDSAGRQHALVRPVDDAARQAITRAVVEALQLREGPAP